MIVRGEDINHVRRVLMQAPDFSVDTETTGFNPYLGDRMFMITVAGKGFSFCFDEELFPLDSAVNLIFKAAKGKRLYFANAKFDLHFMVKNHVIDFQIYDVSVIAKCLDNTHLRYGLDDLGERFGFGGKQAGLMEHLKEKKLYTIEKSPDGKNVKKFHFNEAERTIIWEYALRDAELTYKIGKKCEEETENFKAYLKDPKIGYPHDFDALLAREMKVTEVLFDIERRGLKIDENYIEKAVRFENQRIERAKSEFHRITGHPLIDSGKHFEKILTPLGLLGAKTDKGNPSYTQSYLEGIDHEAAKTILEFRDASKKLNTYYLNFLKFADSDGIVRPRFRQAEADTFRFSIVDPALQTLNSEDDGEYRVRDSFRAREGYKFVSLDYAAQEYRLSADISGEKELIQNILKGEDVHTSTAKMMGVDRQKAKVLNFALLYGAGPQKVAEMLKIDLEEAKTLKDLYFEKLSKISSFISKVKNNINHRGCTWNFAGRVLRFPEKSFQKDGKEVTQNFSYKGPNYLIQSSGAEIMRIALIKIHEFLKAYSTRVVLSIHDEVLIELKDGEEHLIPEIQKLMVESYTPRHGLYMDTGVAMGTSWGRLE